MTFVQPRAIKIAFCNGEQLSALSGQQAFHVLTPSVLTCACEKATLFVPFVTRKPRHRELSWLAPVSTLVVAEPGFEPGRLLRAPGLARLLGGLLTGITASGGGLGKTMQASQWSGKDDPASFTPQAEPPMPHPPVPHPSERATCTALAACAQRLHGTWHKTNTSRGCFCLPAPSGPSCLQN